MPRAPDQTTLATLMRGQPGGGTSPLAGLCGYTSRTASWADPRRRAVRDPAPSDVAAVAGPLPGWRPRWLRPGRARMTVAGPSFPEPLRLLVEGPGAAHAGPVRRAGAPADHRGRGTGRMAGPVQAPPSTRSSAAESTRRREPLAVEGGRRYAEVFELVYRRQADAPNEIWQADHTQLDLWVVTWRVRLSDRG